MGRLAPGAWMSTMFGPTSVTTTRVSGRPWASIPAVTDSTIAVTSRPARANRMEILLARRGSKGWAMGPCEINQSLEPKDRRLGLRRLPTGQAIRLELTQSEGRQVPEPTAARRPERVCDPEQGRRRGRQHPRERPAAAQRADP